MDIRDRIIVKQREIIELYTKYFSNFRIPNFWEKEFDGKLHEIASLEKEQQEQKPVKITDEEIEKWAEKWELNDKVFEDTIMPFIKTGLKHGAKAMRDNEIR